ncbi:hypothetical protein HK100_007161, partial [Physocladia obscura]
MLKDSRLNKNLSGYAITAATFITEFPSQHYAQHCMNYLPQKHQTAPKSSCGGAQSSCMSQIQENLMTVDHFAISLDMTIAEMEITSVLTQQPIALTLPP